ncbi:hypothetical protein [Paenibacillus aestuarii]|uniref:Uncharacterized protein n=1 Tax=Paenibacillus aestuarii TaxID=516965 RepID=A0ABW0KCU1_9BACL|nr:hypothetical protein [Paenibacillus aestuarii]
MSKRLKEVLDGTSINWMRVGASWRGCNRILKQPGFCFAQDGAKMNL